MAGTWLENITQKIKVRIPEVCNNVNEEQKIQNYISDAFYQIMEYSNADKYDRKWDNLLVNCVVTLYNYDGTEGSVSRNANGIQDTYESSNILSVLLSRNITPYLRRTGHRYPQDRFEYPL